MLKAGDTVYLLEYTALECHTADMDKDYDIDAVIPDKIIKTSIKSIRWWGDKSCLIETTTGGAWNLPPDKIYTTKIEAMQGLKNRRRQLYTECSESLIEFSKALTKLIEEFNK